MVKVKRVYDPVSAGDGRRILVDRLWPRGLKKEKAHVDEWLKEIAPSNELRNWFGHEPAKWEEFKRRYRKELAQKAELLEKIKTAAGKGTVTLLYSAREVDYNNAVALKEFLSGSREDRYLHAVGE